MRSIARVLALAALTLPISHASLVHAQASANAGGNAGGGAAQAAGEGGGAAARTTTTGTTTTSSVQMYPGGVAPLKAGQVLGGGNVTSSSSKPVTGNETDSFDLRARTGDDVSVRGNSNGPVFSDGAVKSMDAGPRGNSGTHVVKKGDTLWDICDHYYQNPYQWPRIWSYNPQIQNPHWIEVGEQVNLRPGGAAMAMNDGGATGTGSNFVDGRRTVPPQTIFLREQGFIENEAVDTWGEITGAPEDKMFLMDTDDVYLRIAPSKEIRVGQELTVFRAVRSAGKGKVVQIQGTIRINAYNSRDRIARGTVIETLDVIERGARLASIPRRFEVVPPVRNDKDVDAKVLASVVLHTFYGQNQVVYIDKGSDDGLQPGNRLHAKRRGDAWRQSLPTNSAAKRIALESDSPAQVESIPPPRDVQNYPEETIGELRVLTTKAKTAMCLVTQSSREIEPAEKLSARKGY